MEAVEVGFKVRKSGKAWGAEPLGMVPFICRTLTGTARSRKAFVAAQSRAGWWLLASAMYRY